MVIPVENGEVLSGESFRQSILEMFDPGATEPLGPTAHTFKTGTLQQSENFIWNTADALGRGATAVVYFGRHKTASGHEVLVMEYCSGGSLYNMLEQPQYAYGFPEDEFCLFLSHTTAGMKYLRQRGFIHRDIKPGNIMRYIGEDGRSVFKITDFGAARELQDDETFMSIYGTEEYLYPEMYATAVLRKQPTGAQKFGASVDIWSLGVTIYHVCTGQLPFQPFGGRRNAETMHAITSHKPSGIISGIQSSLNGDIIWSATLPKTCLLSEMLQEVIVKILAGLLENDSNRMWSFDRFFEEVTVIDTMVVLKIFYCWAGQQLLVYLHRTDTLPVLQEKLAKLTDIHAGDQLILWMDKELYEIIDSSLPIEAVPRNVIKAQLYLVSRSCMDNYGLKSNDIPSFPEMPEVQNLDKDSSTAKKANGVAHIYCLAIEMVLMNQALLLQTESNFRRYVKAIVFRFQVLIPELKKTLSEAEKRHGTFHVSYKSVIVLFETLKHLVDVGVLSFSRDDAAKQLMDSFRRMDEFLNNTNLKDFIEKIRYRLEEIVVYVDVLGTKIHDQEKERLHVIEGCLEEDHCKSKVENLKQKIGSVTAIMSKHRKYRELHSHEEFIHKCEKQKLQEYCVALMSIHQEHCFKNLKRVYASSMKQISILTKHLARTKKVEQNMTSVSACLQQLSVRIGEEEGKCKHMVDKITNILRETLTKGSGYNLKSGVLSRSFYPPDGKPAPILEELTKGSSGIVPFQGQNIEVRMQTGISLQHEKTRPELSQTDVSFPTQSGAGYQSAKKARTDLLDQLNQELASLQTDSSSLTRLISENSDLMRQFLVETENLKIDVESLNSRGETDIT